MDAPGLLTGANLLSRPAEEFENDASVEAMWAQKAFEYAEIHFNLLCSVDPKHLRLTGHDDELYALFRHDFPQMKVDVISEDEMKSIAGKEKWRQYFDKLKGTVEDPSFGTLLRVDASGEYSDENTILAPRIQFFAVEVARNREGFNDKLRNKFRPNPAEAQNS